MNPEQVTLGCECEFRGLIFSEVFERYIILGDLSRVNISHVCVGRVFHAAALTVLLFMRFSRHLSRQCRCAGS